jgi:hypothetical protein
LLFSFSVPVFWVAESGKRNSSFSEPSAVRLTKWAALFYAPTPVDGKRGTDFKSIPLSFLGRMEEISGSAPIDHQRQAQLAAGLRLLADGDSGEVLMTALCIPVSQK